MLSSGVHDNFGLVPADIISVTIRPSDTQTILNDASTQSHSSILSTKYCINLPRYKEEPSTPPRLHATTPAFNFSLLSMSRISSPQPSYLWSTNNDCRRMSLLEADKLSDLGPFFESDDDSIKYCSYVRLPRDLDNPNRAGSGATALEQLNETNEVDQLWDSDDEALTFSRTKEMTRRTCGLQATRVKCPHCTRIFFTRPANLERHLKSSCRNINDRCLIKCICKLCES